MPSTRSDAPQVDHVSRDAQHRRQGSEPAESVRPPGVLIVHIFDGFPLDQVKDEDALEKSNNVKIRPEKDEVKNNNKIGFYNEAEAQVQNFKN